jgi:glycosyltransferase involved in cell wall biosynthesis
VDACTIVAKNYIAQARVLARSFAEHHPGGRFWTFIVDDVAGYVDPAQEPFELLTPADIGCEPYEEMSVRYSVIELSTAVKPWLLRHLMSTVSGPITYLDPDIWIFDSLEALAQLAAAHGLVLIPHNNQPIPDDQLRPSQVDIMIAGVYNLGYISLAPRPEVDELLDWWTERLIRDCRVDPVYGYFVDQRWFDLAPGFVSDFAIVRDPQYNVAYWNLHSRDLSLDGDTYTVDGKPLAFFHFSGFDPQQPDVLSRHQNRIDPLARPVLRRILRDYSLAVDRAGYAETHQWPYTFGAVADGVPFDPILRDIYIQAHAKGELPAPPFGEVGRSEFLAWLGAQAPGAPPGVHRFLAHVYGTRSDLQREFPELWGGDLDGLFRWTREFGMDAYPVMAHLPAPAPTAQDRSRAAARNGHAPERAERPPPAPTPWGVNVAGYFRSELGVGEAARQVVRALDSQGVAVAPVPVANLPLSRQGHEFTQPEAGTGAFPINLICVNADMLPDFASRAGDDFFAGRYSIGMWFWEVSRFPDRWRSSFELLDELWAPSAHVADALAPLSPIPLTRMRVPVEMPPIAPRSRAQLQLPDGFIFLFSFDYLSVFERKNPLALIDAFSLAFAPGEGPSLVLKCINSEHDEQNHARLIEAAGRRADIHVLDGYVSANDKNAIAATCDCYVSLHRSEGFGLTIAEAMYLGKPVIATGYSGNLDFMTPENSLAVDYRLVPIGYDAPPYPPDGEWAEPDIEQAAGMMRSMFDDPAAAGALGSRAAETIRSTHSAHAAGQMMKERLEELRATTSSPAPHPLAPAAGLSARVRRGPAPGPATKLGPAGARMRRGVLRLMRPYTAYQETVNEEVVRSLDVLGDRAVALEHRLVQANSAMLAELRRHEDLRVLPSIAEAQAAIIDEVKVRLAQTEHHVAHGLQTDRAVYLALAELARRHERVGPAPAADAASDALTRFELRAFSQNGEDGVLAEILARIGAPQRYFIEFGVESGREANCVYLADVAGWSGLFMEGDEVFFSELQRKYRAQQRVCTHSAIVDADNVEHLLARARVPDEPDVLSIDVDGSDYWIWSAIASYRPRVVVIEYNSALDPARRLVQPRDAPQEWDQTEYFGASLGALRGLAESKQYRLVHTELCGVNAFFVREDLAADRFPDPADVPIRGVPNYYQQGEHHPPDTAGRRYLDLDSGELVDTG